MFSMIAKTAALGIGLTALMTPALATEVVVNVGGKANPFLAGQPNGISWLGDTTPTNSPVLAVSGDLGGLVFTFSADGGFNYSGGTPATSADGTSGAANMTASILGISGAHGVQYNGLVGVFLTDTVNMGATPASRNDGISFAALAPELYQIFWIGDGLTGTGAGDIQQFTAPVGATRLFLGSVDGTGWYNNSGTSVVTINYGATDVPGAVPEPATWAMMIAGFGLAGAALRRRTTARPLTA